MRSRDPQRLESDSAMFEKDLASFRRTYGYWREEGADSSNFTREEDGSSVRRSDACSCANQDENTFAETIFH